MMEALRSSETSVVKRVAWRNIPEDAIFHSFRSENFKSYKIKNKFVSCLVVIIWAGMESSPQLLRSLMGPLYLPWMVDGTDDAKISGINYWQGKLKYSEETQASAALSITDFT
jgi:hypothetical protein